MRCQNCGIIFDNDNFELKTYLIKYDRNNKDDTIKVDKHICFNCGFHNWTKSYKLIKKYVR